ncbi:MAG: 50S ribosomal protein L19 [Patescibacteria group bacterium]
MHQSLISFNQKQRKSLELPDLQAGDVIKVYRKIKEGAKERIQAFQGTIIAIKGGQSSSPTLTIRKVSFGVGVELVLPLFSPQIEKIEFVKRTKARRAKLYFVRDKSVKVLSKKLKEVFIKKDWKLAKEVNTEEVAPTEEVATPVAESVVEEAPVVAETVVEEKKEA